MNRSLPNLLLILFLSSSMLLPKSAISQQVTEDDYWQDQFSVYDGIAYRCHPNGVAEMEALCHSIGKEFEFLGATSGVKVVNCEDCDWVEYYLRAGEADIETPLRLEVYASSTIHEYQIGGVVYLTAEGDFQSLACLKLGACNQSATDPDVVHWKSHFTFSGTPNIELVQALTNSAESTLKTFFTRFVKAKRPTE